MTTLAAFLSDQNQLAEGLADTLLALGDAACDIAALTAVNGLDGQSFGALTDGSNSDGDQQKALDVQADQLIEGALTKTRTALYLSEERDAPVALAQDGSFIVACDPLDGSSNIDTNLSIGTIFSIWPAAQGAKSPYLQKGRDQLAAGFFVYGPQTTLLLTLGSGVFAFCFAPDKKMFMQMDWQVDIPQATQEFAVNAANQRYWQGRSKAYLSDLLAGSDGPRGTHFNMRWCGSLVADGWRIFRRGGIFLYPSDARKGYENGRLRLVYEAAAIAFLTEQAGGLATNGNQPILDIEPTALHQRTALVFGSAQEVRQHASYAEIS